MKYYSQQGVRENTPVRAGSYNIQFDPCHFFAGQWWGVFSTNDATVISALDSVVGEKKQGVDEITVEDYNTLLKKKGKNQIHTWSVMETVESSVMPPPAPAEKSAVSAADTSTKSSEDTIEVPMDDLMKTSPRDSSSSLNHVGSQRALADSIGVSLPRIQDLSKLEGNPGKGLQGYNIIDWEKFNADNK